MNPVDQAYAIDTAIVLLGLMDALTPMGSGTKRAPGDRRPRQASHGDVVFRILDSIFRGRRVFLVHTSTNVADNHYVVNITAMFCGVLQSVPPSLRERSDAEEAGLLGSRADDGIRLVDNGVILFGGKPFWDYADSPGVPTNTNDMVHHVYIIYGVKMYLDHGGEVPVRWTTEDALGSLRLFTSGGVMYNYPHRIPFSPTPGSAWTPPANLWGIGMLIACASAMGDRPLAEAAVGATKESYGDFPDMTLFPLAWSSDTRIYPRFTAHVLYGLGVRDFTPE